MTNSLNFFLYFKVNFQLNTGLSDASVRDVRKVLANLGDRPHEKYY